MKSIRQANIEVPAVEDTSQNRPVITDADKMPDIVLRRLMAEVKNASENQRFAYDRAHNRHNRGR